MPVSIGARLGPYEIVAEIGAGANGRVYRARDSRLRRDVAIKVLRAELVNDGPHVRRFELEARAAAAANHPNITAVHDIGTTDGVAYVVSELLDGATLRDTLAHGALTLGQTLTYARQLADGLAAAHARHIVHRDLKPENVFVTRDHRIKILDFGLSKLHASVRLFASDRATTTGAMATEHGMLLGTIGYMSPEQAEGQEVDARADIFAFGAVLYEMAFGRRAFQGASPVDTLHAILHTQPSYPSDASPAHSGLIRVVRRCLEKDPTARFQSASDLSFAIEGLSTEPPAPALLRGRTVSGAAIWKGVAALLLIIAAGLAAHLYSSGNQPSVRQVRRLSMEVPGGRGAILGATVSPDGQQVAFARPSGLWIRSLDSSDARQLVESDDISAPFWSPDGSSIGFFALGRGKIQSVNVGGGPPRTLADVRIPFAGASWNRDGVVVFGDSASLHQLDTRSGQVRQLTRLDASREEVAHSSPFFLPDGKHFLYVAETRDPSHTTLCIGFLEGGAPLRLPQIASTAMYAEPGYLVFARGTTLMAQAFDAESFALSGEPRPVAERVGAILSQAAFSVGSANTLVYMQGNFLPWKTLIWFNRDGRSLGSLRPSALYFAPSLSPDDKTLVVDRSEPDSGGDIWLFDLARNVSMPLVTDPTNECCPVWMPDGRSVLFTSGPGTPTGGRDIRRQSTIDGSRQVLHTDPVEIEPASVSPDGRWAFVTATTSTGDANVSLLNLQGERTLRPLIATAAYEANARISPDGRWLAYISNESGAFEVYVQPFPQLGRKWRVSVNGGFDPVWRHDGTELFYLDADDTLQAVPIVTHSAFKVGQPVPLFRTSIRRVVPSEASYVVSRDGQRFLVNSLAASDEVPLVSVVLDWTAGLKR